MLTSNTYALVLNSAYYAKQAATQAYKCICFFAVPKFFQNFSEITLEVCLGRNYEDYNNRSKYHFVKRRTPRTVSDVIFQCTSVYGSS